ncbi:MAG: DNA-binding protein [Proteobacteria bacterium]|nr:MAG: DNA-binding protein [Pseudomonadota bacterium]
MPKLYTIEELETLVGLKKRMLQIYQGRGQLKPTTVPNPRGKDFTHYSLDAVLDLVYFIAQRDSKEPAEIAPLLAQEIAQREAEALTQLTTEPVTSSVAQSGLAVPEYAPPSGDLSALVRVVAEGVTASLQGKFGVSLRDKFLLTLEEAHQLSGLSVDKLREAASSGQMVAKKEGRGWKVRPQALEEYCEMLVPSKTNT